MEAFIQDLGILINATLIATPPLLLAALGSCFSERSGVINIGIEGMMTIGAFTGSSCGSLYRKRLDRIFMWRSGRSGSCTLHAFICIQLQADQTIAGTAINFLGPGLALLFVKQCLTIHLRHLHLHQARNFQSF